MILRFRHCFRSLTLAALFIIFAGLVLSQEAPPDAPAEPAAEAAAPAATAPLEERVADLEAYMNNLAPKHLVAIPGPGHNGWMMVSAALVLFMTLPGLALFYGG